jgi:hypothetical protein
VLRLLVEEQAARLVQAGWVGSLGGLRQQSLLEGFGPLVRGHVGIAAAWQQPNGSAERKPWRRCGKGKGMEGAGAPGACSANLL